MTVVLLLKFRVFFCRWLWNLKGQGGTNSLSLVSVGCRTLFVRCRNVSLPSEARLFSFLYLLLCLKYIILLLLLTKKAGLSPSRFQECRNWILHLKVNFHMGLRKSASFTLLLPFISHSSSSTLMHLFICCGLLYSFEDIHFSHSTARLMFFHFALLRCPLANLRVCLCVRVCAYTNFLSRLFQLRKKKKTLKAITPLNSNVFGRCNLSIRSMSYLFIFLSIHLYWKRGKLVKLCLWSELGEEDLGEQRRTLIPHNPTSPWVNLSFCLST